jgi:hypothetical protein
MAGSVDGPQSAQRGLVALLETLAVTVSGQPSTAARAAVARSVPVKAQSILAPLLPSYTVPSRQMAYMMPESLRARAVVAICFPRRSSIR